MVIWGTWWHVLVGYWSHATLCLSGRVCMSIQGFPSCVHSAVLARGADSSADSARLSSSLPQLCGSSC